MARTAIWQEIHDTLGGEIARGHYRPGAKLPSEAALAARFGVNRHTVRHALAALAEARLVHARRGAGVFVSAAPTDYPLGRRVRFHQNISATGRIPSRSFTRMETRLADPAEAEALRIDAGAAVHVVEGLSLADGLPLAAFRSVFPAASLPDLPVHLARTGSVTRALHACGVTDYTRATTRISAQIAAPTLAMKLQIGAGAAILCATSVNVDAAGQPVEFGTTWFPAERVTLTVSPDPA